VAGAGLAGAVKVFNDDDIQNIIEKKVAEKIRTTSFAPMICYLSLPPAGASRTFSMAPLTWGCIC